MVFQVRWCNVRKGETPQLESSYRRLDAAQTHLARSVVDLCESPGFKQPPLIVAMLKARAGLYEPGQPRVRLDPTDTENLVWVPVEFWIEEVK